jgi:signal peptidase I
VAAAGSRRQRPPIVVLLAAVVVLTALVQGQLLQSYFVPSAALAPSLEPGDRVLVWKVSPALEPGDVVVVDTTATAPVDRATPLDDGLAGRVLTPLAEMLGVDTGRQDHLAVVGGVTGDDVSLSAPVIGAVPGVVPRDAVVGTAVLRVWPLSGFGTIDATAVAGVAP